MARESEFHAEIARVDGDAVTVRLGEHAAATSESPLKITLVQGISRSERMDWTLQKATELGVDGDCAGADRTQRRAPRREAGAEETGALARHRDRRLRAMRTRAQFRLSRRRSRLRDYFATVRKDGLRLVLSPSAPGSLAGIASLPNKVELLIGPEGGLDDDELIARAEGRLHAGAPGTSGAPNRDSGGGCVDGAAGAVGGSAVGRTGRARRARAQAARVSSLIIRSRQSKSGISGDSLSMRTWHRIGTIVGEAAARIGLDDVAR